MNKLMLALSLSFAAYFGALTIDYANTQLLEPKSALALILQVDPWGQNIPKNEKLEDLKEIVLVLEDFKRRNHFYPLSEDSENLYSFSGELNENWIPGVVLNRKSFRHQYRYISNGVHYRVEAIYADDCEEIKNSNFLLINKSANFCCYGFWTVPSWERKNQINLNI